MKIFKKNKGMIWSVLISVIIVVIGTLVLFNILFDVNSLLKSTGDKACAVNLFISRTTKIIDPSCQHKTYTIGKDNITDFMKTNNLKDSTNYFKELNEEYDEYKLTASGERQPEWYLNEFMAKQLKNCWDTAGRGENPLFDKWWSWLDCSKPGDTTTKECTEEGAIAKLSASVKNSDKIPTFCLLCSSIHFKKDLPKAINQTDINTLAEWLAANPISRSKTPYSLYLSAKTNVQNLKPNFQTYTTKESQAIVYMQKEKTGTGTISDAFKNKFNSAFGVTPSDLDKIDYVHYVDIVNYDELYNECTYLIG